MNHLTDLQGLNTKVGWDVAIAEEIARLTGLPFITAPNKVLLSLHGIHSLM